MTEAELVAHVRQRYPDDLRHQIGHILGYHHSRPHDAQEALLVLVAALTPAQRCPDCGSTIVVRTECTYCNAGSAVAALTPRADRPEPIVQPDGDRLQPIERDSIVIATETMRELCAEAIERAMRVKGAMPPDASECATIVRNFKIPDVPAAPPPPPEGPATWRPATSDWEDLRRWLLNAYDGGRLITALNVLVFMRSYEPDDYANARNEREPNMANPLVPTPTERG